MSAKWLGVKKVKLATIGLPGGFAKRKNEQHVHDLAASIKDQGLISLPVIDAKTRKLVAGGDRLAALMLNKVTQHEVRLVQGTPAELEAITLAENVWRRRGDDYDAMVKRLVELAQGGLPVSVTGNDDDSEPDEDDEETAAPAKRGRPKTDHGAARDEVAKQLGKTPEAVRQAEKRAKAKEREAEEAKVPEEQRLAERPPVTTYGVPLEPGLARAIVYAQEKIDEADRHLRAAQRAISALGEQGSLGGPIAARVKAAIHTAADMVRRERPDSICPVCKFLPRRFNCSFCGGIAVVSNDKLVACAPELLVGGDKAVVPDGRGGFFPYAREAAGEVPAKKPAPPKKKLDVRGPDGQPVQLPPADDISDEESPF